MRFDSRVISKTIDGLRRTELELEGELLSGVTHTASVTGRFEAVSHEQMHSALANVRSAIADLEAARRA
jgi:hypothetical protein